MAPQTKRILLGPPTRLFQAVKRVLRSPASSPGVTSTQLQNIQEPGKLGWLTSTKPSIFFPLEAEFSGMRSHHCCPFPHSKHTVDWVESPCWPQTPTRDSHALTSNDLPDLKSTRTFVSTCLRYPFLVDAKVLRGGVQKNVALVRVFAIP